MKKRVFHGLLLTIAALGSMFLAACGGKQQAAVPVETASAVATPARNRVIVGVDNQSAPMVFWDVKSNALTGYDIDLAKEVFKRAALEYEFKPITWSEKENDLLTSKKIDVIWSALSISNERKKIFAFSRPYIKNKLTVLVRSDSSIRNAADLKGKSIAVQQGSIGADYVAKISKEEAPAQVHAFPQQVEQFSAVLNGKADAAITDSVLIDYYSANSPGKFRVLQDSLQEEEFGVAVRPNDAELLEKINKALAEMEADGTAQTIYKRWFEAK